MKRIIKNISSAFWGCQRKTHVAAGVPAVRSKSSPALAGSGLSAAIRQPFSAIAIIIRMARASGLWPISKTTLARAFGPCLFSKKMMARAFGACLVLLTSTALLHAQPVLSLPEILQKIDSNNLLLTTAQLRAKAFSYNAAATHTWDAPMIGAGTYMTPYNLSGAADKGSVMFRAEQGIPNRRQQRATRDYLLAQGRVAETERLLTYNDLRAEAKKQYFVWLTALRKIKQIEVNGHILSTMKKIEEVRFPYNQSQLSSVYRAEAELTQNQNLLLEPQGDIARAKAWLNALMNRPGNEDFSIDTTFVPSFAIAALDTAFIAAARADVLRANQSIAAEQLNLEAQKLDRLPTFSIAYDHMSPLNGMMPGAFSVMAMMRIPLAPWSRKSYASNWRATELNIQALQQERAALLHQAQGQLYGLLAQINTAQQKIASLRDKVLPALQKAYEASFLNYQENKLSLSEVLINYQALQTMQLEVYNEQQKLYELIADYEKELFR